MNEQKMKSACPVAVKLLRPIIPEEEIPLDLFRLFQVNSLIIKRLFI